MLVDASSRVRFDPRLIVLLSALGCAPTSSLAVERPSPTPAAEPRSHAATPAASRPTPTAVDPTPPETATTAHHTVSLTDDSTVPVAGTPLTVQMVDAFHKIRAPLVGVSVLVNDDGSPKHTAKVDWRIESSNVDSGWRELAGEHWDEPSNAYVEDRIPGWLVRLDSLDASNSGGSPSAITVSFKPAT